MCCATIMAASTMAMSAGAVNKNYTIGNVKVNCQSYQYSGNSWKLLTQINQQYGSVSVSGVGKYYINPIQKTKTISKGTGGSAGALYYLRNNYGYGWKNCISQHSYSNRTWTFTVKGTFKEN